MQELAQNGYSADEVKSAILLEDNSETMTFRYDRLDYANSYLGDITETVSAGSLSHEYTSDIPSTAKITVADEAVIDYQSDRIRPWVRISMPYDNRTYRSIMGTRLGSANGYYSFNESTGSSAANDANPGHYVGAIGSSILLGVSGVVEGSAFQFSSDTTAAGRVTIPSGGELIAGTGSAPAYSFTIACWVRPDATTSSTVIQDSAGLVSVKFDSAGDVAVQVGSGNVTTWLNPAGTRLRYIVVSWRAALDPILYLDGVKAVLQSSSGVAGSLPAASSMGDLWIGSNYSGALDSVYISNFPISDAAVFEMYRSGLLLGPFGNSNYAEWPQGVYLLSSPGRNVDSNGNVTRAIDCYDQGEAYADDQISTRAVLHPGALYTNVILYFALNYVPQKFDLTTALWDTSNCSAVKETSMRLPGNTSSGSTFSKTAQNYSCAGMDIRVQGILPSIGNGNRSLVMSAYLDASNYVSILAHSASTPTMTFASIVNGSVASSVTINHNAITCKYWRIYEELGYIFLQTSPDNKTWTNRVTAASFDYTKSTRVELATGTAGAESAWYWDVEGFYSKMSVNVPINFTASPKFVPATTPAKEYEPGTTRLAIINDLLQTIAYEPLNFDQYGVMTIAPYQDPSTLPSEFTYANDSLSISLHEKDETLDLFKVPNRWVGSSEFSGAAFSSDPITNTNPDSPTSYQARGNRWLTKIVEGQDAPDRVTLNAQVQKIATQDSQVYQSIVFTTAINPTHTNKNVLHLKYSDLGIDDQYEEVSWSFDMKAGATMKHQVRKLVSIS